MYDVKEGAVKVAGVDIREVAQSFLRKAVAMVPQDIVLFNNTILFNIRFGEYVNIPSNYTNSGMEKLTPVKRK